MYLLHYNKGLSTREREESVAAHWLSNVKEPRDVRNSTS